VFGEHFPIQVLDAAFYRDDFDALNASALLG